MPDLEHATEDELIDRLKQITDAGIIRLEHDLDAKNDSRVTWYWGGLSRCMGMTFMVQQHLEERCKRVEVDSDFRDGCDDQRK